jgi:hypothetical protein
MMRATSRSAHVRTGNRLRQRGDRGGPDLLEGVEVELEAAQAAQTRRPEAPALTRGDVYAMIDYLGDVGAALNRADPTELQRLYEALNLEIIYHADQKAAEWPSGRVGIVRVSEEGGAR